MLSGLGSVTGHTFKFLEPITAWVSHRALGIVFGISVLVHMTGLLFDHFVPFSLINLLVPWTSNYKPVTIFGLSLGSLYVSLGVLAFYGVALIIITSLLWVEKKPYIWKLIHLLSYVVLIFVFIHALYLGTDLASGLLRWLWIAVGIGGLSLITYRLSIARTV
jgi:predicted ferric reductase